MNLESPLWRRCYLHGIFYLSSYLENDPQLLFLVLKMNRVNQIWGIGLILGSWMVIPPKSHQKVLHKTAKERLFVFLWLPREETSRQSRSKLVASQSRRSTSFSCSTVYCGTENTISSTACSCSEGSSDIKWLIGNWVTSVL